jgi:peptide/nickel transport system substrate-binding protein
VLRGAAAAALPMPAIAQDMRARTLRFIPSANLSFIDPTISTAGVSIDHGFAVFDCLYGVDAKNQPKPQMVEGHTVSDDLKIWTFRLRPGLSFMTGSRCGGGIASPASSGGVRGTVSARRWRRLPIIWMRRTTGRFASY